MRVVWGLVGIAVRVEAQSLKGVAATDDKWTAEKIRPFYRDKPKEGPNCVQNSRGSKTLSMKPKKQIQLLSKFFLVEFNIYKRIHPFEKDHWFARGYYWAFDHKTNQYHGDMDAFYQYGVYCGGLEILLGIPTRIVRSYRALRSFVI